MKAQGREWGQSGNYLEPDFVAPGTPCPPSPLRGDFERGRDGGGKRSASSQRVFFSRRSLTPPPSQGSLRIANQQCPSTNPILFSPNPNIIQHQYLQEESRGGFPTETAALDQEISDLKALPSHAFHQSPHLGEPPIHEGFIFAQSLKPWNRYNSNARVTIEDYEIYESKAPTSPPFILWEGLKVSVLTVETGSKKYKKKKKKKKNMCPPPQSRKSWLQSLVLNAEVQEAREQKAHVHQRGACIREKCESV